jgi:low temperature requirement protein LtrA
MLIIALGESVLAIGLSAQGHLTEAAYLVAVLLSVVLLSLLWWVHFADDTSTAKVEEVVERPEGMSGRTALIAFSLGYLVLVAGLILVAAGLHDAVHDPGHTVAWAAAWNMAVGAAVYLLGNVFYLNRLGIGGRRWFAVAAVLCLPTAFAGHLASGSVQVVLLGVVLAISLWPLVRDQRRRTAIGDASAAAG